MLPIAFEQSHDSYDSVHNVHNLLCMVNVCFVGREGEGAVVETYNGGNDKSIVQSELLQNYRAAIYSSAHTQLVPPVRSRDTGFDPPESYHYG